MNVHLFNFSHDLALAHNVANYTPPRNVQIMERDLASLVDLLPEAEIAYNEYAPIWGWDISFVNKLRCSDIKSQLSLPTLEQLADIRRLSSRLTAVEMLPAIRRRLPEGTTVGESWYGNNENENDNENEDSQRFIVKADYSGSGRGLRVVEGREFKEFKVQGSRFKVQGLRAKGDFVVEPYYDKVKDFALEYLVTATKVRFLGLSVFETNFNNAYVGNYIAPQEVLWQRISKYVPQFDFEELIEVVNKELRSRFVGHYLGPVGVDMMVVKKPTPDPSHREGRKEECGFLVHPCVEVNVRRTMGELSLHMLPLLAEGVEGWFRIIFDKDSASLRRSVAAMPAAVYDDRGRLVSGTKLLTPLNADTHYVAVISLVA